MGQLLNVIPFLPQNDIYQFHIVDCQVEQDFFRLLPHVKIYDLFDIKEKLKNIVLQAVSEGSRVQDAGVALPFNFGCELDYGTFLA